MDFIWQLCVIILATKLAGDMAVRLGQPSVLGKLIIGVLLGPGVLGWIHESEALHAFSEIGVLLLMFLAGLETNLKDLNANRKASVSVAVMGILFPLVGGLLAGLVIGMSLASSLFLGLLLSATSVSISVQTLRELGKSRTKESTTILGAALVDDILVVVILAVLMSLVSSTDVSLSLVLAEKIVFFVVIIGAGWKLVPWFMKTLSGLKVTETVISIALVICLGFAYFAEVLGVAGIIGAFAAGIAISQTRFKEEVEHKVEPIAYAVFVPVFFVSIGLSVSFEGFLSQIWIALALIILAVLTKLLGGALGAKFTGSSPSSALVIGAGMVSRGEVALILASIGLGANLLSESYFTTLILVVIATTILAPPLLKWAFRRSDVARSSMQEENL
ncbi:monovalent cation:proton antiporter-2 (CPA2) family protein [Paenibacillus shirakamiensis]|uniref:Monovalent cation:proton antiporter-2 (CPA2) family protein n=1 Tax=Paenibacillus shirakamiensis TaxID=1265935 RepID=A0ABS4JH27_9BACL|nr:cation:proton antiporter [Paenibacillus shirakamiensis]MBP2000350.1 monovalent cation:proton antiporter-2 (CPA2) family protein [Paenibacillus shirakamiensis]